MKRSKSRPAPPVPTIKAPNPETLALQYTVERFLNYEATLLDERHFSAWLGLLADDIRYWMPLSRNFAFGEWDNEFSREGTDLNWFDEGKFELEQRVRQIETGKHWAEEPLSRTTHMITNVEVEPLEEGEMRVCSRFFVYRNRTEVEWDLFVGKRVDLLRPTDNHYLIARRAIYLDQNVLLAKNLTLFF